MALESVAVVLDHVVTYTCQVVDKIHTMEVAIGSVPLDGVGVVFLCLKPQRNTLGAPNGKECRIVGVVVLGIEDAITLT